MIQIRPFDFSDGDYQKRVDIFNAINPTPASVAFERRMDETTLIGPGRAHYAALAEVTEPAGMVVGQGRYYEAFYDGDSDKYLVSIEVLPEWEAADVRVALYDHLIDHLLPSHPQKLEANAWADKHHVIDFLTERGFIEVQRQHESVLDTANFDSRSFAGVLERVNQAGIVMRTYAELRDSDPDLYPKLYTLEEQLLRDVPWHEQELHMTPYDEWLVQFEDNPDLLGDAYVVALDGDAYVGSSVLWASQATDRVLYTGLTGVLPHYRRQGIATALKVRAIAAGKQRLDKDSRPPLIRTSNEISNPMYQINVRLGFLPEPDLIIFLKNLA